MKLAYTRALLSAALNGSLDEVAYTPDPIFGVEVPESCPEVPSEILKPENQWAAGAAYRTKANELAGLFRKNFERFASEASQAVRAAEPVVS